MRRITTLFAFVLLVLGAVWHNGLAQPPTKQGRPPLGIEKVDDDLFVIIGSGGNVGVLVTDEGVVLVDAKFEQDYEGIVAQVKSVTDKPVKYVINTHHHADHSGGNTRFIEVAEIISHKNARANITDAKQSGDAHAGAAQEAAAVEPRLELLQNLVVHHVQYKRFIVADR